jgi:FdhD protein
VWTLEGDSEVRRRDTLVTEEPLDVRVSAGGRSQSISVTMRTPGADFELAAGFLHGEGLLAPGSLRQVSYCADVERPDQLYNVVTVEVDAPAPPEPVRTGLVSSACGVCGSASLDVLRERGLTPVAPGPAVSAETLYGLPDALRAAQGVFAATGGLHAAGLFTPAGELLAAREDVGRHNAVDKLVGWALLGGRLPLAEVVLLVSGRAGYEIVQKAVSAGIPVVASVSAPSSLAVAVAEDFGVTLVGFLRGRRCNVYAGRERVLLAGADQVPAVAG